MCVALLVPYVFPFFFLLSSHRSQLTMMKWHPRVWGPGHEDDEHLHTSVLQDVLPTRTGLRKLASTVAVYRVAEAPKTAATAITRAAMTSRGDGRNKQNARKVELDVSRTGN